MPDSGPLNSSGGSVTVRNARIWTGDSGTPWAEAMTIQDGKIVALDATHRAGRVIDAGGSLVVPGMWDGHTHPHAPYVLTSPQAPTLFGATTVAEVQERLRRYVSEYPGDRFPRLFGWMRSIFPEGQTPTREMIDEVVSDRPVYLVHHGGHSHWANTRALQLAKALEHDPPNMRGNGRIERDSDTGLATGYMEETEYAATHGVLLNTVKEFQPLTFDEQAAAQRSVLAKYPKLGVTSIWTKDGDIDVTRAYETILRRDTLPVRAVLDCMYTPYSELEYIAELAARAVELSHAGLPAGFLRADAIKLFIDLPVKGWIWMLEDYLGPDGRATRGLPAFPIDDFRAQMLEADRLGLQINISVYGDRALRECLDILEEVVASNPPRRRRHLIEHADYIADRDLPRFRELGVIASMNPIASYPDEGYQSQLAAEMGTDRLYALYQRHRELIEGGAVVACGSDFPLAPMDPLVGIHLLVNGTDIQGNPPGGIWPHKHIAVEQALRTYTTAPAYASFAEDRLGKLAPGFAADFAMLSEDILLPDFATERLMWVKASLTVLNGHIVHEDFSDRAKVIDFAQ